MVIKEEPIPKSPPQLLAIVQRVKVEILILQCPPKSFNENVILDSASAVHADPDFV